MHNYRVTGQVNFLKEGWEDGFEIEVFADDLYEAMDIGVAKMRQQYGKDSIEIDDLNAEDLGAEFVYISSDRDAYEPQRKTLTVGELIGILEDFDKDSPVNVVDFNGLTKVYGYLNNFRIEAQSEIEDGDD